MAATVLELSKLRLYEYCYALKDYFGERMSIMGIETDALTAIIYDPQNCYYDDLWKLRHLFDFSNLPTSHVLYSTDNTGKPGKFKIEIPYVKDFIKLKPKVFAMRYICTNSRCDIHCVECDGTGICESIKGSKESFSSYQTALKQDVPGTPRFSLKSDINCIRVSERQSATLRVTQSHLLPENLNTTLPMGSAKAHKDGH
ncbi:unnamed protein product [Orchesella dallaii]|uniref:Uncharacterized protein n=1 Tax=Orchesella dallaii TaxID=48710 RepID=A0ABP1PTX7_9HEXA